MGEIRWLNLLGSYEDVGGANVCRSRKDFRI